MIAHAGEIGGVVGQNLRRALGFLPLGRHLLTVVREVQLVCRPCRSEDRATRYWEEVEPAVRQAVRSRIAKFQASGIRGVDLYLSCFGPALEAFSQAWPLTRGTPRQDVEQTRRRRRHSEVLEVLPVGRAWSGFDLPDAARGAGADFDALENLRRLALAEQVREPEQLKIWADEIAAVPAA